MFQSPVPQVPQVPMISSLFVRYIIPVVPGGTVISSPTGMLRLLKRDNFFSVVIISTIYDLLWLLYDWSLTTIAGAN